MEAYLTMTSDVETETADAPSEADRDYWAEETREDDWQDEYRWELGPGDDDEPTDAQWDEWAGEAEALAAAERGLRHF